MKGDEKPVPSLAKTMMVFMVRARGCFLPSDLLMHSFHVQSSLGVCLSIHSGKQFIGWKE